MQEPRRMGPRQVEGRRAREPPLRGQEEMGVQVWGHLRLGPGLCLGGGGGGGAQSGEGALWASLSSAVRPVALG